MIGRLTPECGGRDTALDAMPSAHRPSRNPGADSENAGFRMIRDVLTLAHPTVLYTAVSSVEPIHSVLLVQSGAMGDCVLQLRIAEAIRRALPSARIAWLGRDEWVPIAQRCASVDKALGLDALAAHRLFQPGTETEADLADKLGGFDLIINGLTGPALPAGARLRGLARRAAISYETKPRDHVTLHICRQWLDQISAQARPVSSELAAAVEHHAASLEAQAGVLLRMLASDLCEASMRLLAARVDANNRAGRLILVHPGSGGPNKCWPLDRYAALVEILSARGLTPVVVAGPAEMERWDKQLRALGGRCVLFADPPLSVLMGLAAVATAYVGNDAGPTHLAAAVGAPTLALFGPTDPRVWRPLGPAVKVLRSAEHERDWQDVAPETVAARVSELHRQDRPASPR